ncbi:MAG: HEAT repeat domain-containing protein [Acidobacteriota bacterium]|nr:HEAT repeat domain-containing protein [Acidobacteriota bacterium]
MTARVALLAAVALVACGCGPKASPVVTIAPPPPTADQQLDWILQLEDQRVARGTARGQDLIVMLGDELAHIRRRAALGAGRARLVEAVEPLSTMLVSETDPEVRQMAAFALGLIGSPASAPALTSALAVPDPLLQGRASEALGVIGHKAGAAAIAGMVRAHLADGVLDSMAADDVGYPKSAAVEAVRLGLYALVRLGAYDELAATLLDPSGRPRSRWWPVAYAFQRVGDPRAVAPLAALLDGEGQLTRAFAARGLGALKHAAAVPVLTALATAADEPVAVRIQAVRALAAIGQDAAAEPLVALVAGAKVDPNLQVEAVTALGQLKSHSVVDLLLDLASASWPSLRAAALVALARTDADTFITVLSSLGADSHWSVRAAVAMALGELGADRGGARLQAMLRDEDQRVIPAVLTALAAADASGAASTLADRLTSDDAIVRMAAANGLARLKAKDRVPALSEALVASERDATYVARAAILSALASLEPEAGRSAVTAALSDRDWAIRLRAAELLRGLDPASPALPATPAPDPTVPELSALDALRSPAYTPTAYIDTDAGTIEIELAVVDAPRTVANFTALARRGFFTNIPFHRVVPDFVAQGGDPRGDGEGGPGYTIRDEINQRPYMRGTVGMALDWADTGGSQFFITHSPQPHLDGRYTVFGQVVSGMDVVDRLKQWDVISRVRIWDGVAWVGTVGTP